MDDPNDPVLSPPTFSYHWGFDGAVAQLVEHLLCKQEVVGSIPIRSTPKRPGHTNLCGEGSPWQFLDTISQPLLLS